MLRERGRRRRIAFYDVALKVKHRCVHCSPRTSHTEEEGTKTTPVDGGVSASQCDNSISVGDLVTVIFEEISVTDLFFEGG